MPKSSKECLKKIVKDLLNEKRKLDSAYESTKKLLDQGVPLISCEDFTRIENRKKVIDRVLEYLYDKVSQEVSKDNLSINYKDKFKGLLQFKEGLQNSFETKVAMLDEIQSSTSLNFLLLHVKPLIDPKETGNMDLEKRNNLKAHAIDNMWVFSFFSKIINSIKERLNVKTSSELLLEKSVKKAEKFTTFNPH